MTDVTPESVQQAESEVAEAEAHLAAAVAAETPAQPSEPPAAATPLATGGPVDPAAAPADGDGMVRLCSARPWYQFDPGDGLPVVTWEGTDVSATVAEMIEAKAAEADFPLRKD